MCKVSVIVCTHNPRREYLQRTLSALQNQTLDLSEWEFILVDNASEIQLSSEWSVNWHPKGRHVREDELGLTAARIKGIKEAQGRLIVFVDDDNVLDSDFLSNAVEIADSCPHVGVFGSGFIFPEYERLPPPHLQDRSHLLALRESQQTKWSNNLTDSGTIPWGAGLCVRGNIAEAYVHLVRRLNVTSALGLRGNKLFYGEDDLFSWVAVAHRMAFGIFPSLKIKHLISMGRLTEKYFLRLIYGHSYSHVVLNYMLTGEVPKRESAFRHAAKLVITVLARGVFSARCQHAACIARMQAMDFIKSHELQPLGNWKSEAAVALAV